MELIKITHVTCALLTFLSFFLRGIARLVKPNILDFRVIKILPHVIDTILLVSAIALASQWMHSIQIWLIVKIIALIFYILLGHKALDRKIEKHQSAAYFIGALCVFLYITSVAQTKSITGPFLLTS